MKYCSKCKQTKNCDRFYRNKSREDNLSMWCIDCNLIYAREYRNQHRDKYIQRTKDWKKKVKYSEIRKHYDKDYYEDNKESILSHNSEYRTEHPDEMREYKKKYLKTPKGKLARHRCMSKRKRELKSIELFINPLPEDVNVDYHHINNILVIPLPRKLHRKIKGSRESHRKRCNEIIKEIYGLDIEELLCKNV